MHTLYRYSMEGPSGKRFHVSVQERYCDNDNGPHWHDFYEAELYLEGHGRANINGSEHVLAPNTLCFLTPSDFHAFCPEPGERFLLINFSFTPECVEEAVISEFMALCRCFFASLDEKTANRLATLMRSTAEACERGGHLSKRYVQNLTSCVLIELLQLQKPADEMRTFQRLPFSVQRALYFVETHFKEPVTLADTARFAGCSPNYLSKMIHESVGRGFKAYLVELRLRYARRMLLMTEESVTEVAYLCGFNSLSHFLHAFKAQNGISPLQFRKKGKWNN